MAEPIEAWWQRRQRSKGVPTPYAIGTYRADWERYPVLIRQYHPDLNHGIALTQIPPAAEVFLSWQCEFGHIFVATPDEQRNRPGGKRRRSVWCPICAQLANPVRILPIAQVRDSWPQSSGSRPKKNPVGSLPRSAGDPFWSALAPKPSSAAEGDLRHRLAERFDFDLSLNAIALSRPFFERFEAWPDIVIPELRVAIEYDTVGRFGLEHVGPREETDRRKDRAIRAVQWEVIRIRCGKLRPIGSHDLCVAGITGKVMNRLEDELGRIRGHLIVDAYRTRA